MRAGHNYWLGCVVWEASIQLDGVTDISSPAQFIVFFLVFFFTINRLTQPPRALWGSMPKGTLKHLVGHNDQGSPALPLIHAYLRSQLFLKWRQNIKHNKVWETEGMTTTDGVQTLLFYFSFQSTISWQEVSVSHVTSSRLGSLSGGRLCQLSDHRRAGLSFHIFMSNSTLANKLTAFQALDSTCLCGHESATGRGCVSIATAGNMKVKPIYWLESNP